MIVKREASPIFKFESPEASLVEIKKMAEAYKKEIIINTVSIILSIPAMKADKAGATGHIAMEAIPR